MHYRNKFGLPVNIWEARAVREGIRFGEGARALKSRVKLGVVHTFISSTPEAETGESPSLKPAWSSE